MSHRTRRPYRPHCEAVEERCVATVHPAAAALHLHALAAPHRTLPRAIAVWRSHLHATPTPGSTLPSTSPVESQTVRLRLPTNFIDYGVVTLWNNTTAPVTFSVSASTFNNGQFYPFSLGSGQVRSFFAPVVAGRTPLFQVSFNPDNSGAIPLPRENVVFESTSYVPQGTAGWPYAIGFGVNGYFLSQI